MELQSIAVLMKNKEYFCSTSSSKLDELLGGGISFGSITEIAGESGSGKTQLCFQLCLNIQIPTYIGEADGGEAVYLDTESTFEPRRIHEMAEALVLHYRIKHQATTPSLNPIKLLSGIYMFRCLDSVQLLAASHQMFHFLTQHPKVKLLVVDSVAHCIRHDQDMKTRTKFLNNLADNFKRIAFQYNIAVVVVNQVTTKFSKSGGSLVVPALGQSWSHVPSTKVMLSKHINNSRIAWLYKSPTQRRGSVRFVISKVGIEDCGGDTSGDGKRLKSEIPSIFLSQTITNELLCNDFEETTSSKCDLRVPEESIAEEWIILSQNQLRNNQAADMGYVEDNSVKSNSPSTDNEPMKIVGDCSTSHHAERSTSPVLFTRPAKKRKKLR